MFEHNMSEKEILIPIKQDLDPDQMNNQMFGVKIDNIHPKGAKLSKKNTCLVELVIDD